ncbi:uncharacterized protein V6R79_016018 [Siganus canaliculatus]
MFPTTAGAMHSGIASSEPLTWKSLGPLTQCGENVCFVEQQKPVQGNLQILDETPMETPLDVKAMTSFSSAKQIVEGMVLVHVDVFSMN